MLCKCGCGQDCNGEYLRGHNRTGKKFNEESRLKMIASHTGKKYSLESRLKMSNVRKKLISEGKLFSKETREKMRNNRLGKTMPESAKEKLRNLVISQETREKISRAGIGRVYSQEARKKISLIHKGRIFSELHKDKLKLKRRFAIFPKKDSTIEIKIQEFLRHIGLDFFTHQYIKEIDHGYQCDILVPSMNLVIECDGDYWHKYPIGRDIDKIRTRELIEKGFKVLRLWEREIRLMNLESFKNKLNNL